MSTSELSWFKSGHSGSQGDNCVEVAACPDTVHVRDPKDAGVHHLAVRSATWTAFLAHAANAAV